MQKLCMFAPCAFLTNLQNNSLIIVSMLNNKWVDPCPG